MRPSSEQTRLIIALLASALAHALALAALAGSYGTLGGTNNPSITDTDEPEQIRLGIERSEAQTIDWIGYNEFQEHLAPKADQNQALMERGSAVAIEQTTPVEQTTPSNASPADAVLEAIETTAKTIEQLLLEPFRSVLDNPTVVASMDPKQDADDPRSKPMEQQPNQPDNPRVKPTPPVEATPNVEDLPGNANKDADAVSKELPDTIFVHKLGKPLAAQGLEIKTTKPVWADSTQALAWPRNPTVRISYNNKGKVVKAVFTKTTGDPDVDRPLLNALYEWTATGDRLIELAGEDPKGTFSISMTIRLR